jgi:hypothetical protein
VSSPADGDVSARVLDVLHRHRRHVLPYPELAARLRASAVPEVVAGTVAALIAQGQVVEAMSPSADPHLPDLRAVALVVASEGTDPLEDAHQNAMDCVRQLQTQLLRGHRCT